MANSSFLGDDDLVFNTSSRIPVCLCLDVSGSMYDCIHDLENGVEQFYNSVRESDTAKMSCEIAVVTFATEVVVKEDFSTVDRKSRVSFTANGGTNMTEGVEKALQLLENRKAEYKSAGVDYYQPWIVIMSDGGPNDRNSLAAVQERMRRMEEDRKLVIFSIGIGKSADMEVLNNFSRRGAKLLKGFKFEEFFEWLGKSVSIVSQSKVGDKVKLDTSTMDEWAEI